MWSDRNWVHFYITYLSGKKPMLDNKATYILFKVLKVTVCEYFLDENAKITLHEFDAVCSIEMFISIPEKWDKKVHCWRKIFSLFYISVIMYASISEIAATNLPTFPHLARRGAAPRLLLRPPLETQICLTCLVALVVRSPASPPQPSRYSPWAHSLWAPWAVSLWRPRL